VTGPRAQPSVVRLGVGQRQRSERPANAGHRQVRQTIALPPSAVEAAPFFSAFKLGLRRMLASDLVRALPNRCLRDIFFVRRSNVWPPSSRAGLRGPGGYNRDVESPCIMRRRGPSKLPIPDDLRDAVR